MFCSIGAFLLIVMRKDAFSFCHSDIANILECPPLTSRHDEPTFIFLNQETGSLKTFPATPTTVDLTRLAHECDCHVFETEHFHGGDITDENDDTGAFLQALVTLSLEDDPATTAAATLLALNGLESAIRQSTGYVTGKAPLLKTMICKLHHAEIGRVCQLLLLPQGVNLRNLLWHGFVAELPRPWLALVVVLTHLLLQETESSISQDNDSPVEVKDLRDYAAFQHLLKSRQEILQIPTLSSTITTRVQEWLPKSHHNLWKVALDWIQEGRRPASICAVLSVLLEHGLRLDWCRCNERPHDAIARPEVFYVTLDGHGQRHVHDLLLHPYLMESNRENALITRHLPGSTIALLMDLFCSSCGGPNIRATVAHGLWDTFLKSEWTTTSAESDPRLWDMVRVLLVSMELTASSQEAIPYRPVFSYAAVMRRHRNKVQETLHTLEQLCKSDVYERYLTIAQGEFVNLPDEINSLRGEILKDDPLAELCSSSSNITLWTAQDVLAEHELNQRLATAGATRKLLQEVADATQNHIQQLQEALKSLEQREDAPKRKRKTWLRIVHSSRHLAQVLYSFAAQVAVLSLQQDESSMDTATLLKAVERSRMVVSTVDTFLHTKVDRAVKSVCEYTKGKTIKAVIELQKTSSS
jgi:hypothetical protein